MHIQINDRRTRASQIQQGSWAVWLLACVVGCSSGDVTDLTVEAEPRAELGEIERSGAEGLTLESNTGEHLSGTFTQDLVTLSFEVVQAHGRHAVDVASSDGEPLLHMRLSSAGERLQLGALTLEGPPGSLVSATEPAWQQLTITGDLARAAEFEQSAEFTALQALSRALDEHADIDPVLLPRIPALAPTPAAPGAEGESRSGELLGTARQAISGDCVVCHGSCLATLASCVAVTGGIFSFVCIPFYLSCRDGCSRTAACR